MEHSVPKTERFNSSSDIYMKNICRALIRVRGEAPRLPTSQALLQSIPGLISYARVTVRWGLVFHAQKAVWRCTYLPITIHYLYIIKNFSGESI